MTTRLKNLTLRNSMPPRRLCGAGQCTTILWSFVVVTCNCARGFSRDRGSTFHAYVFACFKFSALFVLVVDYQERETHFEATPYLNYMVLLSLSVERISYPILRTQLRAAPAGQRHRRYGRFRRPADASGLHTRNGQYPKIALSSVTTDLKSSNATSFHLSASMRCSEHGFS